MIIDVHRHMVAKGMVQGDYIRGASDSFSRMYRRAYGVDMDKKAFIDTVVRPLMDPEADKMIEEMDEAGVDKSVIFGVDYGLLFGEAPLHIFEQNRIYANVAKKHEGRLIPLIAIDPRRKGALRHCKEAYHDWGMKGFKLHAGVGYLPDSPECFWVYEKAAEWNVPVMVHTGGAPSVSLRWENSRPVYVASAASRYPEVKFIMAHCGDLGWWYEAMQAANWLSNVYVDLSLWQKSYKKNPARFYKWLRHIIDEVGPEKVLFATDAPFPNLVVPLKDWVRVFSEPDTDIEFTQEEKEMILGKAAEKVFDL